MAQSRRFALLLVAAVSSRGAWASLSAEMQEILDAHNLYRCMHDIPLYTWDDAIATNAQAWADNAEFAHSTNAQRTHNGEYWGENLAWGSNPGYTGKQSTDAWYNEIEDTSPRGTADSSSDTTGGAIGHYTQVVWKASVRLGCAKGTLTDGGGAFWVCQYGPGGNMGGEYTANVLAPAKAASECGGGSNNAGGSGGGSLDEFDAMTLPSACTPSTAMPHGSLCVYGYQCASSFCCPRLKVCLTTASSVVSSGDISVEDSEQANIVSIVFGGTCNPFANAAKCMQTSSGQPMSTWDQSACSCHAEYMTRYEANTWVTLNKGVTCSTTNRASSTNRPSASEASVSSNIAASVSSNIAIWSALAMAVTFPHLQL